MGAALLVVGSGNHLPRDGVDGLPSYRRRGSMSRTPAEDAVAHQALRDPSAPHPPKQKQAFAAHCCLCGESIAIAKSQLWEALSARVPGRAWAAVGRS